MSKFLQQRELFDKVLLLNEEEKSDPLLVVERFFGDYRLNECRHQLWTMVETCLTTENDNYTDPAERGNLLHHYRDLERLLEASMLLLKKGAKKTTTSGPFPQHDPRPHALD
ncbi:MAG TPA: hypothetical protein VN616_03045 [Puia sp.]|nr:hypothetical protein [Puia sp.]